MPDRVIALLLALVLLWSGLATVESPRVQAAPADAPGHTVVVDVGDAPLSHGSVEHHHLDDLPSQTQNDPPGEPPAMPCTPWTSGLGAVATARLDPPRAVEPAAPFLEGPLRPPRPATPAG